MFKKPFDREGVKLDLKPVSSINFLSILTTSFGVNSFNPVIKNANKPLVIRASEYPSQNNLPPTIFALTKTSETHPLTLFSSTRISLSGSFNFLPNHKIYSYFLLDLLISSTFLLILINYCIFPDFPFLKL